MRKVLAVMLIGGILSAGMSTAFAGENSRGLERGALPTTSMMTTGGAVLMRVFTSNAPTPDHDRN